ncbi:MAG TPA: ferric reductase-like transmembrane domain-containing protein [archaeon]|nr:ferric reductase-like transmembrane domain-containing protein [archaeon]
MLKHLPTITVALVIVSLLVFYTAYDKQTKSIVPDKLADVVMFKDAKNSLRELNKVAALASIGLLAIAFLLGPLSKIIPHTFAPMIYARKPIGLAGFVLGLAHGAYSFFVIYGGSLEKTFFENPKMLGAVLGIIGLFIFFLMAITSTEKAVKKMGYARWKTLQRTGYIALFFVVAHFIILEVKPDIGLDVRPYGLLFLFIAIVALALKAISIFIKVEQNPAHDSTIFMHPEEKKR